MMHMTHGAHTDCRNILGLGSLLLAALTLPQWAAGTAPTLSPPSVSPPTAPAEDAAEQLAEFMVEAPEPRYVAPTRRDQIGRIWAPVFINGRGPFRLVLDTGASSSGVTAMVALALGIPTDQSPQVMLRGVTGSVATCRPYVSIRSASATGRGLAAAADRAGCVGRRGRDPRVRRSEEQAHIHRFPARPDQHHLFTRRALGAWIHHRAVSLDQWPADRDRRHRGRRAHQGHHRHRRPDHHRQSGAARCLVLSQSCRISR